MKGMSMFEFYLPTRLIFGEKSFNRLGETAGRFGKRALLVTDPVMDTMGVLGRAADLLKARGMDVLAFSGVLPNPTSTIINETADTFRSNLPDVVIGIGGGSSIDSAKALAVALSQEGDIWQCINEKGREVRSITASTLPVVAVPTTAGTGAEVTAVAVLVNPQTTAKRGLYSEYIFPKAAIVDPELMMSAPPRLTAATGIDALSHAIEACISKDAHAYAEMTGLAAIRYIAGSLPVAVANGSDLKARSQMAWGATLAGIAISNGDVTLVHALGHPLSGRFNIGHGEAIALGLPGVMRHSWMLDMAKFARIAEAFGVCSSGDNPRLAARKSVGAVEELLGDIGLSLRLRDFGVKEADIEDLAKDVTGYMTGCLAAHPKACSMQEIAAIYREML
jgi:alcohol dehydrogenase class IV